MKKTMKRLLSVAIVAMGCMAVSAQGSLTVDQLSRASRQQNRVQQGQSVSYYNSADVHPFGTFFVEYNPTTMHYSYKSMSDNTSYQGISVGANYFTPFAGALGADFGLKLQYFFRNETENNYDYKDNMLSATIPVDLAYDWHVSDGFAIYPYAGLYARFNISASRKVEHGGSSTKHNPFSKDDMGDYTWDRFQFGWQAGVNFRISDMITIGGGYWMDLNEIDDHTKLYGFNITLGANF